MKIIIFTFHIDLAMSQKSVTIYMATNVYKNNKDETEKQSNRKDNKNNSYFL